MTNIINQSEKAEGNKDITQLITSVGLVYHPDVGFFFQEFKDFIFKNKEKIYQNKTGQVFVPDPELMISHVSPTGSITFQFNQEMLLPDKIPHDVYQNIIKLSAISQTEDLSFSGIYSNLTSIVDKRRLS